MATIKDKKSPAQEQKNSQVKNREDWKVEDSNLYNGIATPYIALFEESGEPILNPITGIALGAYMSNFQFKSGDEDDDACVVTVDTGDPDTVDIEGIQENKIINVQWGYIYPDGSSKSSRVHTIEVKQLESVFDDQGTHITIHCKDSVSNLRQSLPYKPSGNDDRTMKDFLDEGMGLDVGIIIEMFE